MRSSLSHFFASSGGMANLRSRERVHGHVWTCGRNDHGQCGTGTMKEKSCSIWEVPEDVVAELGAHRQPSHLEERRVLEWCPFSSSLSPIQSLACGSMHSVVLGQDKPPGHTEDYSIRGQLVGTLFSTGSNNTGQLGLNHKYDQTTPIRVEGLYHSERVVLDIQCGPKHNIALARAYSPSSPLEIWTWGQGWYGRLGHGDEQFQLKPKMIASCKCEPAQNILYFLYLPVLRGCGASRLWRKLYGTINFFW